MVINFSKFGYSIQTHKVYDECSLDISYILFWNNRIFQIFVSDDSGICGFCFTTIPDIETCLSATIYELRNAEDALYEKYDNVKHEMHFSFDIEKGTFIELFCLAHKNIKNIVRECEDPYKMDKIFKDKVILDIPEVTKE